MRKFLSLLEHGNIKKCKIEPPYCGNAGSGRFLMKAQPTKKLQTPLPSCLVLSLLKLYVKKLNFNQFVVYSNINKHEDC